MTDHLEPCPFCGEYLRKTYGGLWTHDAQSGGDCILSSMGMPDDHISQILSWNTRVTSPREAAAVALLSRMMKSHGTLCWGKGEFNQAELNLREELTNVSKGQTQ